ncbi:hypothetical protein TSAR_011358, partial [Trichomalopsis sarcophagae]
VNYFTGRINEAVRLNEIVRQLYDRPRFERKITNHSNKHSNQPSSNSKKETEAKSRLSSLIMRWLLGLEIYKFRITSSTATMGRKSRRKSKSNQTLRSPPSKAGLLKQHILVEDLEPNRDKPILITDRLSLPAYHNDDPDDYDSELQLDFQPRPYYASSLCYVCSKPCEALDFSCDDCRLVVYCSAQHRQQNLKQHKQLCTVLAEICGKNKGLCLAKNLNADEYRSFRVELLQIVENALGRRMELWEREIMLYPRLCRVCHSSDDLRSCPDCLMEFFCNGDEQKHRGDHRDHCEAFKVFRRILAMQRENGFVAPRIPDFVINDEREFPENFDELIKVIFAFGCDYEKIDCASYAALSQAASPALTAFYALRSSPQNTQFMNRKALKIHVIGAELQFECANLSVWEKLFLHLLPGIKSLKLEFCGPELHVPADIASILERPRLCTSCRAKNRKIDIVFHCGKLYHQVDNEKPDLVCLFNPGLYRTTGFANQSLISCLCNAF